MISPMTTIMGKKIIVACILAIAVFSIPFTFTYLYPRPYGVEVTDVENDYYYNGKLLAHGYALNGDNHFYHPGTPIQFLSAFLIRVIGSEPEHTQTILNIGRLIAGVLSALSLALFVFLLPKGTPASVALFAGVIIIIAPPFMSQLDYFGVDPFLVAPTLVALALLWREINERERMREEILTVAGFLFGLASTIKLTALPVAVGMFFATSVILYPSIQKRETSWERLIVFPASVFISFVFFTLPIFHYYPAFIRSVLAQAGATPFFVPGIKEYLLTVGFFFPIFSFLGFMSIVTAIVLAIQNRVFSRRVVFLFFLLLPFVYFLSKITAEENMLSTALGTRYILPSYLFIAFCVLYIFHERQYTSRLVYSVLVIYSFIIFLFAAGSYVLVRTDAMEQKMAVASVLDGVLDTYYEDGADGERAAIWFRGADGGGVVKPKSTFHFWGNYRYGDGKFTEELLEYFPHETFFDYGTAKGIASNNPVVARNEVILGEKKGARPAVFLFHASTVVMSNFGRMPEELEDFLAKNYMNVAIPEKTLQFLIMNFNRGVDVLEFLSKRYKKSFSVFPVNIAGSTWIFVAEEPPSLPDDTAPEE